MVKPIQTQNNRIAQVLLLVVFIALAFVANLSVAPNIVILSARLDFFVLFLAVALLKQGRFAILLCAFACGLLSDFVSAGTFGIYTFSYCLAAFAASYTKQNDMKQHSQLISPLQKYMKLLILVVVLYSAILILTLLTEGLELLWVLALETYLPAALYVFLLCMLIYLISDIIMFFKGRAKTSFDKGSLSGQKSKLSKKQSRRGKPKWTQ